MDNRNGRHLGLQSTGSHSLGHPQFGLSRMQLIENLENLGRISLGGKIRPVRRTGDKHRALDPGQAEMESSASLLDLAWTLQAKRTELPFRKSFTGATKEQLLENMRSAVLTVEEKPTAAFGTRSQDLGQSPKILGVFTGQGAQWPSMGAELLRTSRMFVESIQRLEESLGELTDAPEWSLHQELSAAGSDSRVHLAEISQPLCTAVQIALVDLLHAAGAQFCAVIGPLVWGVHARHATGTAGQSGSMMAVGTSFVEARALCEDAKFAGRLVVAASNAPSSVTISADKDAINELKVQLDQQGTFARVLKVDKAYHSHHMLPCTALYLDSLNGCGMQVEFPTLACWVSSVHGKTVTPDNITLGTLSGSYWVDNMALSVLFSQAVEEAVLEHGPFDVAIEIGPHEYLGRTRGKPLGTLPMTEWIGRAMQAGMNEMVGMYLQEVTSKRLGWYPPVVSDTVN